MIRFDTVTKKYPGTTRPALNDIDLEILRGEFVFLVGASGSGKSSCLRLMLKEEKPSSGKIHVLGQDLGTISSRKVPYFRRNLGVVFQDFRLLPNKSVYANVAFTLQVIGKSRGFIQEAVPDTLKMVGLEGKAQRLPHELSGGEQQRVAIARAIVNKPQVLLADEPTGNLDPVTSAGIMTLLERINASGTTIVMATHEAGIVDQMKRRVIELSAGQIVRDERSGGYGATTAIPIVETVTAASGTAGGVEPVVAAPAAATAGPKVPLSVMENARPLYVEPEVTDDVTDAAAAITAAATAAIAIEPVEPPTTTMSRPVLPVTRENDVPEQLTLAEKLGLRAPGANPNDTGEQEVGPTR
ncbi:MAG: cell division ATP-binding protein FtsE [Leifsonia sp.]